MADKDTGGSAFPTVNYVQSGGVGVSVMELKGGMTLRDYFAAKCMQGFMANSAIAENNGLATRLDEINAKSAYAMADAMIKAREA